MRITSSPTDWIRAPLGGFQDATKPSDSGADMVPLPNRVTRLEIAPFHRVVGNHLIRCPVYVPRIGQCEPVWRLTLLEPDMSVHQTNASAAIRIQTAF
jgi:hypothetical protein